ncbi:MAG: hypothetical protein WCT08_04065 [Patescibacteria group bacterium]|jgi:hypothetical protein
MSSLPKYATKRLRLNHCPKHPNDTGYFICEHPDVVVEKGDFTALVPEEPFIREDPKSHGGAEVVIRLHWDGRLVDHQHPYPYLLVKCIACGRVTAHYYSSLTKRWEVVVPRWWRQHVEFRNEGCDSVDNIRALAYKLFDNRDHICLNFFFNSERLDQITRLADNLHVLGYACSGTYLKNALDRISRAKDDCIYAYIFGKKSGFLRKMRRYCETLPENIVGTFKSSLDDFDKLAISCLREEDLARVVSESVRALYQLRLRTKSRPEQTIRLNLAEALLTAGYDVPPKFLVHTTAPTQENSATESAGSADNK